MKRIIPIIALVVFILVVYLFNLHEKISLEWFRSQEQALVQYVNAHPFLSVLLYLAIYILSVTLVIPDSTILTLFAGVVFPLPLAILYAVVAETVGATAFFFAFHTAFGTPLLKRERPIISKLRSGFQKNEVHYLLFLRISHVIPFWCTNVAAAYFKVNYRTFIWTSFVGVIPLSAILTYAGHSISILFQENSKLQLSDIFTTQIKIALLALGLIALCPVIYKVFLSKRKWKL